MYLLYQLFHDLGGTLGLSEFIAQNRHFLFIGGPQFYHDLLPADDVAAWVRNYKGMPATADRFASV